MPDSIDSIMLETPFGPITISSDKSAVKSIRLGNYGEHGNSRLLKAAKRELEEYFDGKRKAFTVPVKTEGTRYQRKVWSATLKIPYGETRTYGWIAEIAGGSARSAGNALGANPIPIIIPCHRIIRADGEIGGYGGGLEIKRFLLEHEKKNKEFGHDKVRGMEL